MNNKKKIIGLTVILVCVLFISLPFVVSCADGAPPVDKDTIFNLLFPNIWVFGAVILATAVLLTTIIWMVWVPFNKKMEARKEYINKEREEAEQAKLEALKNKSDSELGLVQAQAEANAMVSNATIKATSVRDEIIHKANEQANTLMQNAKVSIENERNQMQQEINDEVLEIAFDAVTQISKQKITREENDKLVKEFLEDFNKDKNNGK